MRAAGIEPASQAWEAHVLPMNYAREDAKADGAEVIMGVNSSLRRIVASVDDALVVALVAAGLGPLVGPGRTSRTPLRRQGAGEDAPFHQSPIPVIGFSRHLSTVRM